MAVKKTEDNKPAYFAVFVAWLLPGAGHWYLQKRQRAVIIFCAINITFLLGLYLGGIEMIDPHNDSAWFCAQLLSGLAGLISMLAQNPDVLAGYGHGVDLGQVYSGVAGLLNVICIMDVLVSTGRKLKK